MSIEDDLRKIAGGDQAEAGFRTLAQSLGSFYDALRKQGFRRHEALTLTLEVLRQVFQTGRPPPA